ncbi:MAG: tetratricopeptide repeat protein [Chloroflexi bacterium]|nr:tetratricopeptide repeat protein [Chloroflexota bacterium]
MIKNYFLTQTNPFFGRQKELADIQSRLTSTECRLLTLTGLGGSGKTRLAIEAAQAIAPHFHHGVVFVGLQQITKGDLLIHTIAQAIGLTFYGGGEPEIQFFSYLREKSLLLLLDNFEHLLANTALVSAILAQAPNIKILVTSREALNLQEEWLYPLKGMSIPLSTYTTSLEDYEAVQLFLYHARRTQPNFELTNEQEAVIRICKMTAGLPLAIELAASWLKGLTASQIATEIQCNLDFLSTTSRNIEARHRSMRAVFDHSWKLMSEKERMIFAEMSVFCGSFDSNAAEQVVGASLPILAALVEKSLVQMEMSSRFSIHELLRQYGVEKLEEHGEPDAAYERHCQYYANWVLQHETVLKQPRQLEAMRAIETDFENIRLAWDWASKNHRAEYLEIMLNGLYLFGFLGNRYRETIAMFQQALDESGAESSLLGRLLSRRWGYLHWWYQADYRDALTGVQQALTIALDENDTFEIAFGHLKLAYVMISMQRYAEALPHLETSKTLFEHINEPYYVCWVLHRLGYVYGNLNENAKSHDYTEQSLLLARSTHNHLSLVICLYNLGSDYLLEGDYLKGRHYCEEALQVANKAGHRGQIAHSLSLLALCAFCQGDYATCQEYAERSHLIIEDINLVVFQSYNVALLILLACMRADYIEGVRLKESEKRHNTNTMGYQLLYWALAILSCGLENPVEAGMYVQQVLQLTHPDIDHALISWIVPAAAYALAQTDRAKAVELLGWVWACSDNALNWIHQWPPFEQLQAQLQDGMGTASYKAHWEKGTTLTIDTINIYLRREFCVPSEATAQQLLTVRENEILRLMAIGMTNPQIAAELVIGAGTVKTHTLNIYRKLDVTNRTQAIVRAQELGLLPA